MKKSIPTRIKLYLYLLGVTIFSISNAFSQDSLQTFKINVPKLERLYTDRLSDLYVSTTENELIKYSKTGNRLFKYSETRYGKIGIIDLSNPLSILLFYPDFGMLTILDRNLSLQSEINLRQAGYQSISAIGLAADNNIWIYDAEKFRLVKLDPFGKEIRKSNELTGLIGNHKLEGQIWEQDNFLFIRCPGLGWIQFDDFGSFIQLIPLPDKEIMRMEADKILYIDEGEIIQFDLSTLRKKTYPVPNVVGDYHLIDQRPGIWIKSIGEEITIYKQ